jgi:hypothetical protein
VGSFRMFDGAAADRTKLQETKGPLVLHVSSHAFFGGPGKENDPALHSGIALAGANLPYGSGVLMTTGLSR